MTETIKSCFTESVVRKMFFKIGAIKNFANFTEKHLCRSLILIKLLDFNRDCSKGVCAKFLSAPFFLQNTSGDYFWS